MSRFRLIIAALVAVAMMSLGAAACTPADQAQAQAALQSAGANVETAIYYIAGIPALLAFYLLEQICNGMCT